MYLAELRIRNYRCFADEAVALVPGVNVLVGENNAGKTTILSALGLLLDQRRRHRPGYFDFHQPVADLSRPPRITISLLLRSTKDDTLEDKALVADWLTKLEPPWEATLTYTFGLEPDDEKECTDALATIADNDLNEYRRIVESFLPRYVSRTFGGDPKNALPADREMLAKIDFQLLDALRDADRELFAGSNPLLKRILTQVRDSGKTREEKAKNEQEFRKLSADLGQHLRTRVSLDPILTFVTDTGAMEGGKPTLKDNIAEDDILAALRLYVETTGLSIPAENNGMGYNNLIYISLVLASIDHAADPAKAGPNATSFPILCIEEPEAHLHPALQYKLLKHLQERVTPTKRTKQVFITTHSTHITSAVDLDNITCLTIAPADTRHVAYPAQCFPKTTAGTASKAYVERYLDATKSNLLFAKGIIFVEGLAELLLVPVFAEQLNCSLATHHVAVISVGGSTFHHFLPLFGGGLTSDQDKLALRRPVACLLDGDPARKANENNARYESCYPYQLDRAAEQYAFRPLSPHINTLETLGAGRDQIMVRHTVKTLEYDLAYDNYRQALLVTAACAHEQHLKSVLTTPETVPTALLNTIANECADLAAITDEEQRTRHRNATLYLHCVEDAKGEHAFALARQLKQALVDNNTGITIPEPIEAVIRHATNKPKPAPEEPAA
jgi:putative ATP-dependent endonuclease of OLD family